MIKTLKELFGLKPKVDLKELVKQGAIIIDVRSKGEFKGGHLKNSINIPLDTLTNQISKLDKNKPIICCCASGMRSASAKSILISHGYVNVHNGGGWNFLHLKIA